MTVGDLLEWVAAVCFTAAGYLFVAGAGRIEHGLTLACLVAGVCLFYFAQCYSAPIPKVSPPKIKLPKLRRRA